MMKLSLARPDDPQVRSFIDQSSKQQLTYDNQLSTLDWPDSQFHELPNSCVKQGYLLQYRRRQMGSGEETYRAATQALRNGVCFDLPWVDCVAAQPFEVNDVFCLLAKRFSIWGMNACRVLHSDESVETHPKTGESLLKYSVVIGTLENHVAIGEERIGIIWNRGTDRVDFLIGSFSKPANFMVQLIAPLLRHMQDRFATDAGSRLLQEIQDNRPEKVATVV